MNRAIILLSCLAVFTDARTQDHTLQIWPDEIPGSIADPDYKEERRPGRDGRDRIRQVTDPTIEVFLPGGESATGTAVIICPGGGYGHLAINHEGYDVARWLNSKGIAGIVLKYRLPSARIMEDPGVGPLQDAQEAIRIVRRHAAEWKLDRRQIGILGFSAGGHLAASASTLFREQVYQPADATSARPDFAILVYGALSAELILQGRREFRLLGKDPSPGQVRRFSGELQVGPETPPAFLVHSLDDPSVDIEHSIRYLQAMQQYGIAAEMHIYERGGHGYGLGRSPDTESGWPLTCLRWLRMHGYLDSGF